MRKKVAQHRFQRRMKKKFAAHEPDFSAAFGHVKDMLRELDSFKDTLDSLIDDKWEYANRAWSDANEALWGSSGGGGARGEYEKLSLPHDSAYDNRWMSINSDIQKVIEKIQKQTNIVELWQENLKNAELDWETPEEEDF